jgi:hypothetical protein
MSRGPGKIERAIIAALAREPGRQFATDEVVRLVYGARWPERKRRVAVRRARRVELGQDRFQRVEARRMKQQMYIRLHTQLVAQRTA